jgi:ArsR family transcriptional regulator
MAAGRVPPSRATGPPDRLAAALRAAALGATAIQALVHARHSFHIDDARYVDRCIDRRQYVAVRLVQVISEECCPEVLRAPLGAAEAEEVAAALRVVADPARLRLLSLISNAEGGEACVCNLTEPLGLSQPTVSHHLKVLADAGLLEREQRGRWAYYRIVPERLELLRGALVTPPSAVG